MTSSTSDFDTRPQVLRRFLLDEVDPAERERLETRVLEDESFLEHLEAAEDDLLDDYARDQLSPAEVERFETRFLAGSSQRRERLRARVALAGDLARVSAGSGASPSSAPVPASTSSGSWRWLAAAAALVALVASGWLATRVGDLRSQLAAEQLAAAEVHQELEQLRRQSQSASGAQDSALRQQITQLEQEADRLREELDQARTAASSTPTRALRTGSFVLSLATALRAGEPAERLAIPQGLDQVELQVDLDGESGFDRYRVALRTLSGEERWSRAGIAPEVASWGHGLELVIPADSLSVGDYELMIFGEADSGLEEIGFLEFRVSSP